MFCVAMERVAFVGDISPVYMSCKFGCLSASAILVVAAGASLILLMIVFEP